MKTWILTGFILVACGFAGTTAAELRLAIVPADPRVAVQAELLTVEFSRPEHGVALLERAEVERVRREQNLTTRGSADFARLGQTLGAQGVLALDVFEQTGATNLTVKLIAVQPGVALGLQSYRLPIRGTTEWAGLVGKQFIGLLPKLGVLAPEAVPVSILNLRSPLRTGGSVRLENEATTLLIHRLMAQREIFVLERQRLALLGNEKELQDVQDSAFWNGSYLLEGVVERGGATRDTLNINARLVAPGRPSLTVSGRSDTGDLNTLVDELTRDLIARLGKSTSSTPWNPAAEAKRYLQEARWGMRWGNVALAQAAADSAWALGERSLETALIRVNSYVQMVGLPRATGSKDGFNFPPGQVSEAALSPVITALENFAAMTPTLGTNTQARNWQEAGLAALQTASGQLWNFWHVTNEAAQAAETLARLRAGAREVERIFLEGAERPDARAYATGPGTNLWNLKLGYGWVFTDSMADTLAEFRRLFPDLSREQLRQFREHSHPWLMPWTANERARAETVWNAYLDEQAGSTNAAVALTARVIAIRALSLLNTPSDTEAHYQRRQQAAETFVKHRHELLCHEPELLGTTLARLDRLVRRAGQFANFSYELRTNCLHAIVTEGACFDDKVLAACLYAVAFDTNHLNFLAGRISEGVGTNSPAHSRRLFLRTYLANQYRWYLIEKLFRAEDYSDPAEARKMLDAFNQFISYYRSAGADDNVLAFALKPAEALQTILASTEKPAPASVPIVPATPVATNTITQNTLSVNRWWQPVFSQSETQQLVGHCVLQTLARVGYVWVLVRGAYRFKVPTEYPDRYIFPERAFEQFFRIDPSDLSSTASPMRWEETGSVLPMSLFTPFTQFDVLDGVLYEHQQGKVSAWSPRETQWRHIDVELPGRLDVTMRAIGGRLYFGSSDTLVEFNPSNAATRVMASLRRNPPLVAEDRLPGFGRPVFLSGGTNSVFVLLGGIVHPWHPESGRWSDPFAGPGGALDENLSPDRSRLLCWLGQGYEDQQLRRFSAQAGDELLFDIRKQEVSSPISSRRRPVAPTPRWQIPADVSVHLAVAGANGTNLWCLDWKRRLLAYFDDQWNEPLKVHLDLQSSTMMNLTPAGMMQRVSFLPERRFLVISPRFANGLWIIPQADMDRALARNAMVRTPNRSIFAMLIRPAGSNAATNSGSVFADESMADAARILNTYLAAGAKGLGMGEMVTAIQREPALAEYRSLLKNFFTTLLIIDPYDTNGNQRIDLPELDAMIKAGKPNPTRDQFMQRWDTNGNDKLDLEEINAAVNEKTQRILGTRQPRVRPSEARPVKPPSSPTP